MARWSVAVFDDSADYIRRMVEYANSEKEKGFELAGFSDTEALDRYLEGKIVDILLFSMEDLVEKKENREEDYERFLSHPNVREFIYFGERRNSKTTLRHINKYQPAGKILEELGEVLRSKSGEPEIWVPDRKGAKGNLICVYAPAGENGMSLYALQIAELKSVRKRVLFIDLDRFSLIAESAGSGADSSVSELIFYYKTNRGKLGECLREKRRRINNLDFLSSPEDMEDIGELPEEEWPAFLGALAENGRYEIVVVFTGETFRKPEYLFDAAGRIYLLQTADPMSARKMEMFTDFLSRKGRRDLLERAEKIRVKKESLRWN